MRSFDIICQIYGPTHREKRPNTSLRSIKMAGQGILRADEFKSFPLVGKEPLSEDTAVYRFKLAHADDNLGVPVGHYIFVKAGKVVRPYAPVSVDGEMPGFFELLIQSVPGGAMSRILDQLTLGESLGFRAGGGQFQYDPEKYDQLDMITTGTGIAPLITVIKRALLDKDGTCISLLYTNPDKEHTYFHHVLENFVATNPDRFRMKCIYEDITKETIKEWFLHRGQLLLCGLPEFTESIKLKAMNAGYVQDQIIIL